MLIAEHKRPLVDDHGRQPRGLQNRLRGAAEASWVGSIPIHPRQFALVAQAKTTWPQQRTAPDLGGLQWIPARREALQAVS